MDDIDKVKTLLSELGIGFEMVRCQKMGERWKATHPAHEQTITCREGMNKVEGYCGFVVEFYFDGDGKFISMGIWE